MEKSRIPFAVFQFIGKRVVALVVSDGFCSLFGFADHGAAYHDLEHDLYAGTHPDDIARATETAFHFAKDEGEYDIIYRTRQNSAGQYRIIHARGEHICTETGVRLAVIWYSDEGLCSSGEDDASAVTDAGVLNTALNHALHRESLLGAVYYDSLTGLPNMAHFFELAEAHRNAIRENGGRCVILFMNLSGMKFYNSKYGFAEGDRLLKAFAEVLIRHFSSQNCGRFGQDHFVVCCEREGIGETLSRIFEACRTLNEGRSLPVRVGIAPDDGEKIAISTACDRARLACDSMRNSYVSGVRYFERSMQEGSERQQYIIENLDRAIAENWIQVYYQPIVRATNGRVCDEEALARWIDPVHGFLSPADFIPILEDARLIYKLDLYITDQVLAKIRTMEEAGLHIVPQSVNLSRSDFDGCDIVEEIRARADSAGISRSLLTIEITESIIGSDFEFMREQILRFQKLGFPVWMDDFGSAYSSLDVLQRIPFDLIKFDMRFMQQFDQGDRGKIILTELMKMAVGLGIDTVCEGVETEAQASFLREIGCSKMQGYYFERPIPLAALLEKYRTGMQIGFENPTESGYFDDIGRVNLYDLAVIAKEDGNSLAHYFSTLPMAIIEIHRGKVRLARSNHSYRDFMKRSLGIELTGKHAEYADPPATGIGFAFVKMILQCCESGSRALVDEKMPDNTIVHSFIRRIAVNPVTGTSAVVVAVLAVTDDSHGTTYGNVARALAADYYDLYYVDLDTEDFIEYSSNVGREDLAMEKHGKDFFTKSREDALQMLYPGDLPAFLAAFTKENILHALDLQGNFRLTYRLNGETEPFYVSMKVMRMNAPGNSIIIGVSNVDAQMKEQAKAERIQQDQITYNRIAALDGGYICVYTVEADTGRYVEYRASRDYTLLGIPREGKDFFGQAQREGSRVIAPGDLADYRRLFTEENVRREIEQNGSFTFAYRLLIEGRAQRVRLKAVSVTEASRKMLIIGVRTEDHSSNGAF